MRQLFSKTETNNYKLFFPFAIPGLLLGLGLWIFNPDTAYNQIWHPWLMTYAFLFPIILGFIWTGIPRFIAAEFPSAYWKITYFILISLSYFFYFNNDIRNYKLIILFSYSGLMVWYIAAFFKRKTSPIFILVFLFYALLAASLGNLLIFLYEIRYVSHNVYLVGLNLYRFIFFLFLIGSVGSRLIPVMGKKKPPEKGAFYIWSLKIAYQPLFWIIIGAGFVFILATPVYISPVLLSFSRFLVLLFFLKEVWFLFRPTENKTFTFMLVQFTLVLVTISPFIHFIPGVSAISADHFLYLSMHYTLVLIVVTRVILSHGGYGLEKESKSNYFALAYSIMIIVIFIRTFTDIFLHPEYSFKLIAILLLAGTLVWLLEIVRSVVASFKK